MMGLFQTVSKIIAITVEKCKFSNPNVTALTERFHFEFCNASWAKNIA